MAKPTSLVKLSGKIGDMVHVDSARYGKYVREPARKGVSKNVAAVLKKQNNRTKFLNNLASELNAITGSCYGSFRHSNFYHTAIKYFRREKLDNRYFLLLQLKGLDLHPHYPFNKLGRCATSVTTTGNKLVVALKVTGHPQPGPDKSDSYSYDVLLIGWDRTLVHHSRQYSEWVRLDGEHPEFEFIFSKTPGCMHWLLCLRQQLGKNGDPIASMRSQGIQIAEVVTFDKKDKKIIIERMNNAAKVKSAKPVEKVVRVKAKRWEK